MPIASLTRVVEFSASHRLHVPTYSIARNRKLFGKCNSPNGHGHNYKLEVTVTGKVDPDTGMVINLTILKEIIESTVIRHFDHRNLNLDLAYFKKVNPTAENIAIVIWRLVSKRLPSGLSLEVKLFETGKNIVVYRGA